MREEFRILVRNTRARIDSGRCQTAVDIAVEQTSNLGDIMRKTTISIMSIALAISGCATAPPGTPGAGSGETYTPFVDLHGVDSSRYQSDLAGCRSYAQQINAGGEALKGMIGGMIFGALMGAAIGGNSRSMGYGANVGGGAGLGAAGGRAVNKQETVIANCLAGRGYRVLEGATVATNTAAPSPYLSVASTARASPAVTEAPALQLQQPQTAVPMAASFQQGAAPAAPLGQDAYSAGKLASSESCTAQPLPVMAAKGPGFESYSVACSNGDTLMIRCEFGSCRVLR